MASHIILLGDSIFDNKGYVPGEPDVIGHLRSLLPASWRASLRAVDGSMTTDMAAQLADLPPDASHLVVSIGGNDALMNSDLLALPVRSTTEALMLFSERAATFERSYRSLMDKVVQLGHDTTICTVYNGNLPADQAPLARIALMLFNDVILRTGFEHRLRIIDLRLVCTQPEDYANPIEPSGSGGRKIAEAIAGAVGAAGGNESYGRVFSGIRRT